eukprot:703785-Rhodomonas_salina.1
MVTAPSESTASVSQLGRLPGRDSAAAVDGGTRQMWIQADSYRHGDPESLFCLFIAILVWRRVRARLRHGHTNSIVSRLWRLTRGWELFDTRRVIIQAKIIVLQVECGFSALDSSAPSLPALRLMGILRFLVVAIQVVAENESPSEPGNEDMLLPKNAS